jgi:hypothetical protein
MVAAAAIPKNETGLACARPVQPRQSRKLFLLSFLLRRLFGCAFHPLHSPFHHNAQWHRDVVSCIESAAIDVKKKVMIESKSGVRSAGRSALREGPARGSGAIAAVHAVRNSQ